MLSAFSYLLCLKLLAAAYHQVSAPVLKFINDRVNTYIIIVSVHHYQPLLLLKSACTGLIHNFRNSRLECFIMYVTQY